ncbi:penicillin acylase family protein [Segetibacter sp. 3557_3]|uniref:penicillin acylase family protein n=1 Tax=Segetibacter sp. 3557_3 TaxID=2547429 RepID=UPI0010591D56|nr:penicillin acylase family protein [Segetibacter sp. 3557_3]TDH29045.1 penicillin acylase family protein [Segetibacter sp. 3557_3]
MRSIFVFLLFIQPLLYAQSQPDPGLPSWKKQAHRVTIIRDNWGVPHIYGKTDADVVFGLMYAQCEDNYWQLEDTYIQNLGRAAEIYGERFLAADANTRLFECVTEGKATYAAASPFIRQLCDAGAAAINFYLHNYPALEKRLLTRYEPWFFLMPEPTRPSGHGVSAQESRNFYQMVTAGIPTDNPSVRQQSESGSNTMVLAPSKTTTGHTMLLINPHVSLFGVGQRYEAHLVSKSGLNVSGFAMFGNFYIWSGFNRYTGWAHTNSAADFEDVYVEHFNPTDSSMYRYANAYRKATFWQDTVRVKRGDIIESRIFRFTKTHHGPVVARRDSTLLTIKNVTAPQDRYIMQCWNLMRSRDKKSFTAAMNERALGYPNTSYADRFGNIAYWHGNAIPKRDTTFNWRLPVDGSNPATEWAGIHELNEIVQVTNPATGFILNSNSTPYLSAGESSPKKENYPLYMATEDQNFRAEEALQLLSKPGKISFDAFEKLVVSNHLPMMENWMPQVISAYDRQVKLQPHLEAKLKAVVALLRNWDHRYSITSKETSLAVAWYLNYTDWAQKRRRSAAYGDYVANLLAGKQLPAPDSIAVGLLADATDTLVKDFGTAFIAWGEINRLQRVHTSGTLEKFDDRKPSLPVGAVPGGMGSLFAFTAKSEPGQKKIYGVTGNTYSAIVAFGKRIRAKSIMYFGQSADPASPHYFDQAPLYASGGFKDAYFYKSDVLKHRERRYHPGE